MLRRTLNYAPWLIMLLLLTVRLFGVSHSPFEVGELWRQSDTESIALLFTRQGFAPLRPSFFYDGPYPNVVALELQITPSLIALLYKLFGRHFFLARLVPIGFFLLSCCFVYLLGKRWLGERGALWAMLIYGIIPVNLYVSRSIQPESAGLCFYTGALYFMERFRADRLRERRWLALAGLFAALAVTQKPQTALIAIPMFGVAWQRYRGWAALRQRHLWVTAGLALCGALAYYGYSHAVAEFHFASGIAQKHILARGATDMFRPEALAFYADALPRAFTWPVLLLTVCGLIPRRRQASTLYLWLLASIINLLLVVAVIKFWYYLVYLTPPLALLAGGILGRFRPNRPALPLLTVLLVGTLGVKSLLPLYQEDGEVITQGRLVQELTAPDDLIVVSTFSPVLLNASERFGWRYQIDYYPGVPTDPVEELAYYRQRGARWFVTLKGFIHGDPDGRIRRYLDERFRKVELEPGYVIYDLQVPLLQSEAVGHLQKEFPHGTGARTGNFF